jgi:cytochrome c-type biogenesis protein CcmH/NrfG
MPPETATRSKFWPRAFASGIIAVTLGAAPVRADAVSDIYERLQADPRNVALNLEYARAAEGTGKLKWALPAFERALSADPGNQEARQGLERVRAKLRAEGGRS